MSERRSRNDPSPPSPTPEASAPDTELNDFLCFAIYETNLAFNDLYRRLLESVGLTYPQYLVMTLLWRRDKRTVKGIGEALGLEYNTLTPLIKRLETMGLVTRERDLEDQRVVNVALSPKGRDLRQEAHTIPGCVAEASGLSDDAFADLKAALKKLRDNLETHRKSESE